MIPMVVVGDIHGEASILRLMLEKLESLERKVVFVGDYVNGGADSAGVIEQLCRKKEQHRGDWHFLAGNHDLGLRVYLSGGDFGTFAALGGVPTIRSYITEAFEDVRGEFNAAFPKVHRDFIESLEACYEDENILVSHAGFAPKNPRDRGLQALTTGNKAIFNSDTPRSLVVCGHYLQRNGKPFCSEKLICLDTGCGIAGGPLTALLLPERTFFSIKPLLHDDYVFHTD